MTLDLDEPGFGNVCSKVNPRTVEGAREYSFICVDGSLELLVLSFAARLPREGKGNLALSVFGLFLFRFCLV